MYDYGFVVVVVVTTLGRPLIAGMPPITTALSDVGRVGAKSDVIPTAAPAILTLSGHTLFGLISPGPPFVAARRELCEERETAVVVDADTCVRYLRWAELRAAFAGNNLRLWHISAEGALKKPLPTRLLLWSDVSRCSGSDLAD